MKAPLALALVTLFGTAASAQDYLVTGELDNSDYRYDRPDGFTSLSTVGTNVLYEVVPFVVSETGQYVAEANGLESSDPAVPSFDDIHLTIYRDEFDPNNPLQNLVNGSDDTYVNFSILTSPRTAGDSRIAPGELGTFGPDGLLLNPGTTYFAVVTAYRNLYSGRYELAIGGGPGAVTAANPVPEPTTLAGLAVGALAFARRRKR